MVTIVAQRLEGPITEKIIQDFIKQKAMEKKKVEVA
jgi:hypothetical protein